MKLYNRTRIPDSILTPLLTLAGRGVGARTGGVVVQVNPARTPGSGGLAVDTNFVRIGGRWIKTDKGYYKISLYCESADPIASATAFLHTARHEWGHIRDFQAGGYATMEFARASAKGRRPEHDIRPEEIRAERYIRESDSRLGQGYFDDVILTLAIAIEEAQRAK